MDVKRARRSEGVGSGVELLLGGITQRTGEVLTEEGDELMLVRMEDGRRKEERWAEDEEDVDDDKDESELDEEELPPKSSSTYSLLRLIISKEAPLP